MKWWKTVGPNGSCNPGFQISEMSQEPRPISSNCIYPSLVGCSTPVEAVLSHISSNMWWVPHKSFWNFWDPLHCLFLLAFSSGLVALGSLFVPETSKRWVTSVLSLPVKSRHCQFGPLRSQMWRGLLKSMNRYARDGLHKSDSHTMNSRESLFCFFVLFFLNPCSVKDGVETSWGALMRWRWWPLSCRAVLLTARKRSLLKC